MRSMMEGRARQRPASPVAPSTTRFAGGPPPHASRREDQIRLDSPIAARQPSRIAAERIG